jgi:hypothetical protein
MAKKKKKGTRKQKGGTALKLKGLDFPELHQLVLSCAYNPGPIGATEGFWRAVNSPGEPAQLGILAEHLARVDTTETPELGGETVITLEDSGNPQGKAVFTLVGRLTVCCLDKELDILLRDILRKT